MTTEEKTYFIYVRSTGEKVPVTKTQHDSFYKEADRIRHKEQDHGRCMCPYRFIWKCDGDCIGCEYHAAGDITSLDQPLPDGNGANLLTRSSLYRSFQLKHHFHKDPRYSF